jgi:tetraacyldisaccharide 4'-kinase
MRGRADAGPPDGTPPRGPLPGFAGRLASRLYARGVARRNARFDAGPPAVVDVGQPVISVGNLSVGGTGKTPMVRHIARVLIREGHTPCIAMRGYRATPEGSDEASGHVRALPGVPVVAQPDRVAGLRSLFDVEAGRSVDCVILDDGFQHRRVRRALDLVLVDATRNPLRDRLLPAGWLREPVTALARADGVVITHAEAVSEEVSAEMGEAIGKVHGRAVLAVTRHDWSSLAVLDPAAADGRAPEGDEPAAGRPVSWLSGLRALGVCAIGNPEPFFSRVAIAAGELVGRIALRDHDPYKPSTVGRVIRTAQEAGADVIVTTDKDWSKLADVPSEQWPCPVARPRLVLAFDRGENELSRAVLGAARGA